MGFSPATTSGKDAYKAEEKRTEPRIASRNMDGPEIRWCSLSKRLKGGEARGWFHEKCLRGGMIGM